SLEKIVCPNDLKWCTYEEYESTWSQWYDSYDDMVLSISLIDCVPTMYLNEDSVNYIEVPGVTLYSTPRQEVEETGIDLYSTLAISGAMLILACGCAVVMSKMKRKQSI
ncbi:MAG: hypothetical protein KBT30_01275, partial [Clostridiales bacterium]|nr:hypothetical protein [Candidatus Apopatousia equi]